MVCFRLYDEPPGRKSTVLYEKFATRGSGIISLRRVTDVRPVPIVFGR
jgi:hypothetical protein